MVKSMTGYGRSIVVCGDYSLTVEMKSVNSRFLEINCRLPRQFSAYEDSIKKAVQAALQRGKVDVFLTYEYKNGKRPPISIDKQAILSYYNELRDLCDLCGISEMPHLVEICHFPNVLLTEEIAADDEELQHGLKECVQEALQALLDLREKEGKRLIEDLQQRIQHLEEITKEIVSLAPLVASDYREKLLERMKKILADIPLDEARILQEAAIFADKADITEEITRLRSHTEQFKQTVKSTESIGRTLDFIVQEMNREVNTIGSKANFTTITKLVIEAKSELEKVREQIQNLE